jgi:ferrous iron transport protein B
MDGVILLAFILGWPANETVLPIALMIYLSQNSLNDGYSLLRIRQVLTANGWTSVTACCTLLFTLMHWPCSTALITAYKETKSIKWTVTAALLPTAFGYAACITVRLFASLMGV